MTERASVPNSNPDVAFDGETIARADREFLAGLADHPLKRNPLYGIPCPPCAPQPNYGDLDGEAEESRQEREEAHAVAQDWLLVNWAYREGAFRGKGGAISLVDGEVIQMTDLRERMAPWDLRSIGPKGGKHSDSPVSAWRASPFRLSIRREEMRPGMPRPVFEEDGYKIFNRYRPPAHPTEGGDIAPFLEFFGRLYPVDEERAWMWNYLAHKVRKPWVPMVGTIMVAPQFGAGRGTLSEILVLLFGKQHVEVCSFDEITKSTGPGRFNKRIADALIVYVNEAVSEDGSQQSQKRLQYEQLKIFVDPSPTQLRRFEQKNHEASSQVSSATVMIFTQHRDVAKLPSDDRRFCVPTCGRTMTREEREKIRAWLENPANIGALYRALMATPAPHPDVFDPYGQPPNFQGRREMIGMARSEIEDAYAEASAALGKLPLFTMTQMQRLMGHFGTFGPGHLDGARRRPRVALGT
jgi:hypothetical protein